MVSYSEPVDGYAGACVICAGWLASYGRCVKDSWSMKHIKQEPVSGTTGEPRVSLAAARFSIPGYREID